MTTLARRRRRAGGPPGKLPREQRVSRARTERQLPVRGAQHTTVVALAWPQRPGGDSAHRRAARVRAKRQRHAQRRPRAAKQRGAHFAVLAASQQPRAVTRRT